MQTTSPTYQFFSGSGDTYTVQLPPGEARTDYDLYAVYVKSDGKKVLAGKLRVRTESPGSVIPLLSIFHAVKA